MIAHSAMTYISTWPELLFDFYFCVDGMVSSLEDNVFILYFRIFGFVAKKKGGNQCLLFAEMDPDQPASAVVNFVTKVLLGK